MGAFFWHLHRDIPAVYAYKCRDTSIDLRPIYTPLCEQIEAMSDVALQKDEQKWLFENTKVTQDYLVNFLAKFRFDPKQVKIKKIAANPGLEIRPAGPIQEASLWEIPLMSTISELYFRNLYGSKFDSVVETAKKDLNDNVDQLLQLMADDPLVNYLMSEFGTRRRLCMLLHDYAVRTLKERIPNSLVGTSNMFLAKKHGIKTVGTQAHEALELYQAIVHPLDSQRKFLRDWIEFYRGWLGIALTDTLGDKKWDEDFTKDLMIDYIGQRHDSGDPYPWGERRLAAYERESVDPKEKTLLFSDNLNFGRSFCLSKYFGHRTNVTHGLGTFITNFIKSLPGHKALNQVIKIVWANGKAVLKLGADGTGMKMQCEDEAYAQYMMQAVNR